MAVTQHDVRLDEIYYRDLLALARDHVGATIEYGELVKRAKRDFPDDDIVKGALPRSIGKRLFVIEDFCIENNLPNLACLAVNQRGIPGESYTNNWAEKKKRASLRLTGPRSKPSGICMLRTGARWRNGLLSVRG